MKYLMIMLTALMVGCAGSAVREAPENLSFVKVSQGKAKGMVSLVTGRAEYCMVELFNIEGVVIDAVTYDNGNCSVSWHREL